MIQTKLKCQTVINLNCVNFQSILSLVLITLAKFSCYKEDDGCVEKLSAAHRSPAPVSILWMLLAVVFQQLLWCLSPNLNCIQHWMKSYFVICTQLLHHSIGSRSCSSQIEFSNKHSRNRHYHCSNPLLNQSENMFSFTDKDNEIKWVQQTIFCFQEWFNNFLLDHLSKHIK